MGSNDVDRSEMCLERECSRHLRHYSQPCRSFKVWNIVCVYWGGGGGGGIRGILCVRPEAIPPTPPRVLFHFLFPAVCCCWEDREGEVFPPELVTGACVAFKGRG